MPVVAKLLHERLEGVQVSQAAGSEGPHFRLPVFAAFLQNEAHWPIRDDHGLQGVRRQTIDVAQIHPLHPGRTLGHRIRLRLVADDDSHLTLLDRLRRRRVGGLPFDAADGGVNADDGASPDRSPG